jgi:kinetochore protein NDC80
MCQLLRMMLYLTSVLLSSLPSYSKKRDDYATDLQQFHDLLRQMEEHKSALEMKVKERTTELSESNDKLALANNQLEKLKQTVNTQQLSVDDLRKLENEMKGVIEATERSRSLKEERKKKLSAAQEDLSHQVNQLEGLVVQYNHKMSQVALLVPSLTSKGVNSVLRVHNDDRMLQSHVSVLGVDLQDFVRPTVEAENNKLEVESDKCKRIHLEVSDKLKQAMQRGDETSSKLQILKDKIEKLEENIAQEQDAHMQKMNVRQREVDSMETKIDALRDPVAIEEQMASYERQCAKLEIMRQNHQEDSVLYRNIVLTEINAGLQLMKDHDTYWRHKNDELSQYWDLKQQEAKGELSVPANIQLD